MTASTPIAPGTIGRVEPKEARTVRCFGHTFKKGAPANVTDPAILEKLLREGSLRVTLIRPAARPAPAAATATKAPDASKPVAGEPKDSGLTTPDSGLPRPKGGA